MVYVTHSTFTRQQWPGSVELRKGLDVNIASAMASEPSDRTKILNSIRLPRAGTVFLEQEARDTHESNLIDLWSSFPSDFLSPRAESTLTQRDHVPKMPSVSLSFCRLRNLFHNFRAEVMMQWAVR